VRKELPCTSLDSSQAILSTVRPPPAEMDFSRYAQRKVALEVMYLGGTYQGFARQDMTDNTIEAELFQTMRRTKLIPEDAEISSLSYSRCGRTDKGVSALGQVIALNLRSCGKAGQPAVPDDQELDYPKILNRTLPPEIRVLGWATVGPDFNARFSAHYRGYKYFIVQQTQEADRRPTLDIEKMREAARHFEGLHDFRNFCKQDVLAARTFKRRIHSFTIEPEGVESYSSDRSCRHHVYSLNVRGTAFLWHQVRCMAAVLLMVGRGLEEPDVIKRMLDVELMPCKPQYTLADEAPLLLYECGFDPATTGLNGFRRTANAAIPYVSDVTLELEKSLVASALASVILSRIKSDPKDTEREASASSSRHQLLKNRAVEPSVEERMRRKGVSFDNQDIGDGMEEDEDDGGE
jgi:tRNA pseudouridine38/39 synthase